MRQEQTRHAVKSAGHLGRARRPQYLFSGLTKCGVCGALDSSWLAAAEREIERIEGRRKKLIEMVMEGVPPSEVKDELTANAARREDLKAKLAAADAPPPLLHPEMAELYRQKVTTLSQALQEPETRVEATEALRGLIDAIILTPSAGELRIDLKGNLAAMLSAATNAKRSPETGDLSLQVEMVAGAGFEPATFGL